MGFKLGTTALNKLYLGTTEIKKAYIGSTLFYDKTSPPPSLSVALVKAQYQTTYPNTTRTIPTDFGPASANRRILAFAVALGNAVDNITIGGVAATIHQVTATVTVAWGTYYSYWFSAVVPTGTSGNIVAGTGVSGGEFYGGRTYAITGAASVFDAVNYVSGSLSGSVGVTAGGAMVAMSAIGSSTAPTGSWDTLAASGVVDTDTAGGYMIYGTKDASTTETASYTCTVSGATGLAISGTVGLSFKL